CYKYFCKSLYRENKLVHFSGISKPRPLANFLIITTAVIIRRFISLFSLLTITGLTLWDTEAMEKGTRKSPKPYTQFDIVAS
ncbi:hypothetical protein, partial [Nocardioides malaquae]|uniref:hypothetical protein n=1 Tax=Nocardioides malaquae TaxID=2773426 RepID=UPI001D0D6928